MKRLKSETRFVICLKNEECEDLEPRKIYRVVADPEAAEDGYIRVIDESGEDYLYPQDCFLPIELPQAVQKALLFSCLNHAAQQPLHLTTLAGC
jgi:hypothetical protein